MPELIDIYEELGIPEYSDITILKAGMRRAQIKYHPDKFATESEEIQKKNRDYLGNLCQICNYLFEEDNKIDYDTALKQYKAQQSVSNIESNPEAIKAEIDKLMKQRCDLVLQMMRQRYVVMDAAYKSKHYVWLKERQRVLNDNISSINCERYKVGHQIKITEDSLANITSLQGYVEFSAILEVVKQKLLMNVSNLKSNYDNLDVKLLQIYRNLEQTNIQISELPGLYYAKDPELQRLTRLDEEVKEKMAKLRDMLDRTKKHI